MTWGFVASFGGVIAVFALLLVWEKILARSATRTHDQGSNADAVASLVRAEAAAKQVEIEIARARSSLLRNSRAQA